MPTNFPLGFDLFTEPTIPEETVLSSAGTGSRNHPEHHRDLGDAIEAIEHNVALKGHIHGGGTGDFDTSKLLQANTHEGADTDSAPGAIHHTIGIGANQAAAGNHVHPAYVSSYQVCTSSTRPASPFIGLLIFETNTGAVRIWAQFPPAVSPSWRILPVAMIPNVRLRQSKSQQLVYSGSTIEWTEELEDPFGFFNAGTSLTDINMNEPGLYQIECGLQWDPQYVPDVASMALTVNGAETTVKDQRFMRGNLFTPGFSQTLSVSGKLRFAANDVLRVRAKYTVSNPLLDLIHTFFDFDSRVNSRIDISFLGP